MGQVLVCDLCGKPIHFDERSRHFKVKELKHCFEDSWWKRLDVHDECMRLVLESRIQEDENG